MPDDSASAFPRPIAGPGVTKIAAALGLPPRTVRALIDSGEGPAFQLAGRWFARPADWASLLTPTNIKPPAEPEPKPAARARAGR